MKDMDNMKITYPGGRCEVAPLANWTIQERWAWREICEGRIANLSEPIENGSWFDPGKPDIYPQRRVLTSNFIKTILLYKPFNKSIPSRGVCIVGARFEEVLDLSNTQLEHVLELRPCTFNRNVDFSSVTTSSLISFDSSTFEGDVLFDFAKISKTLNFTSTQFTFNRALSMYGIKVGGGLLMRFGAKFSRINLTQANIDGNLEMMYSRYLDEINLSGSTITGLLNVCGAKFIKNLNMDSINVRESVFMSYKGEYDNIDLRGAHIGKNLELKDSLVNGTLILNGSKIGNSLIMENYRSLNKVMLRASEFGINIELNNSVFDDDLEINSVAVGNSIFITKQTRLKNLDLISVKVGGQFSFINSILSGDLQISAADIHRGIFLKNNSYINKLVVNKVYVKGQFLIEEILVKNELYIESSIVDGNFFLHPVIRDNNSICRVIFSEVSGNLDITKSYLAILDLTGTDIRKDFTIGRQHTGSVRWRRNSKLILRNTYAEAIQDSRDSWPREIELDGFTYTKLGGLLAGDDDDMVKRDIKWFKGWLGEGYAFQPYENLEKTLPGVMRLSSIRKLSPQPYEQLAKVLRNMGYPDKANTILYSGKKREMSESGGFVYIWLLLQDVFIGFSYRIWYSLLWILFFVVLGFLVFNTSTISANYNSFDKFFFSLDMLLPIIELSKDHEEILSNCLIGFPKYYFYVQQILGYVLASFIIGGLTKFIYKL